jgi:hypothetical protein
MAPIQSEWTIGELVAGAGFAPYLVRLG